MHFQATLLRNSGLYLIYGRAVMNGDKQPVVWFASFLTRWLSLYLRSGEDHAVRNESIMKYLFLFFVFCLICVPCISVLRFFLGTKECKRANKTVWPKGWELHYVGNESRGHTLKTLLIYQHIWYFIVQTNSVISNKT